MAFMSMLVILFFMILWKWSKALLIVIFLEMITVVVMAVILLQNGSHSYFPVFMFSFFVSEALILITSLYSSLRFSGNVYSGLIFI